jgi:hypothetical protein
MNTKIYPLVLLAGVSIYVYIYQTKTIKMTTPIISNPQTQASVTPLPEGPVAFQLFLRKGNFSWKLKRNDTAEKTPHGGLLNSNQELAKVWENVDQTATYVSSDGPGANYTAATDGDIPSIDFTKNSVIWYGLNGPFSNVNMDTLTSHGSYLEAHVVQYIGDYGSNEIKLWIIPKTTQELRIMESAVVTHEGLSE